jgi:hypothetical protein
MPATTFPEYVQRMTDLLNQVVATGEIVLNAFQVDQRSAVRGLIAGIMNISASLKNCGHRSSPSSRGNMSRCQA